jgi:hypothetical protein
MHTTAYVIIFFGLFAFASAAYDEHRGVAVAAAPTELSTIFCTARRADDPQAFRNLMTYQWIEASLVFLAGFMLLGLDRRAKQLDPFSEKFAGSKSIDDLERTLKDEEARRH